MAVALFGIRRGSAPCAASWIGQRKGKVVTSLKGGGLQQGRQAGADAVPRWRNGRALLISLVARVSEQNGLIINLPGADQERRRRTELLLAPLGGFFVLLLSYAGAGGVADSEWEG